MTWFCYLLRCADDTFYCGITNDLEKRVAAHNAGTASKYTRVRLPVEMIFVEECGDRSGASKREMEIKRLKRAEKLALIKAATPKKQKKPLAAEITKSDNSKNRVGAPI